MEMGRTFCKNEGQQTDQTLQAKEREEMQGTNKEKIARQHSKGGNHMEREGNLQWMDKAKMKDERPASLGKIPWHPQQHNVQNYHMSISWSLQQHNIHNYHSAPIVTYIYPHGYMTFWPLQQYTK